MTAFASAVTNLKAALDNYAQQLADVSEHPKPFYVVNEQTMDATTYARFLSEQIDRLRDLIVKLQGPYRVTSTKRPL